MALLSEIARELNVRAKDWGDDHEFPAAQSIVTHDSRCVVPGGIFAAIKGATVDGNRYVQQALERGAVAIISELPRPAGFPAIWLQVNDARMALAQCAAIVHCHPSRFLKLVGITGTNGKTTTAHLCESIFRAAGTVPAIMGTVSYRIGDQAEAAEHTTPEAPAVQDFLRRAVLAGSAYAVMEVSSIAIDMHRVDSLSFEVAAFTNLTQDHLDYHGTMEAYGATKRRLFEMPVRNAVINIDDQFGVSLTRSTSARVYTYAINRAADICCRENDFGAHGLSFEARTPGGGLAIKSPLVGRPHAYNILCAIGIGTALGINRDAIVEGINVSRGASGRLERVEGEATDVTVVVDYAHTPDALDNVLKTARDMANVTGGRVITIFGCGGDRDRTKRPLMGECAARLSDLTIATSDNPRTEDPDEILREVETGLAMGNGKYILVTDRREAILKGITEANPRDVILIAGKGHEDYQIIGHQKSHFDDREVARDALRERAQRG